MIIAAVLIAAVFAVAAFMPEKRTISDDAISVTVTEAPAVTAAPEASEETEATATPEASEAPQVTATPETSKDPEATAEPVKAYLVVSVGGILYEPLPLGGEGSFTLQQDENITNTVHVTPTSICLEHSSCDNQDCVQQGTVSLDNMDSRVLANMIIYLPNEVVLELHTPESLETTFGYVP